MIIFIELHTVFILSKHDSVAEIHKVLVADVHTRAGAACLLGADAGQVATDAAAADLEKASRGPRFRAEALAQVELS